MPADYTVFTSSISNNNGVYPGYIVIAANAPYASFDGISKLRFASRFHIVLLPSSKPGIFSPTRKPYNLPVVTLESKTGPSRNFPVYFT